MASAPQCWPPGKPVRRPLQPASPGLGTFQARDRERIRRPERSVSHDPELVTRWLVGTDPEERIVFDITCTNTRKERLMEDLLGLSGRYAVVMGGGLGIGRESALLLARSGSHVAVADIDVSRAEAVATDVAHLGVRSIAIQGDVRVPADVERMVDQAADFAEGRLEILINMIGMATFKSLMELDDDTWDRDLNLNLRQHLYVSRAVARKMIDAGIQGRMAMVASVNAFYGATVEPAYGVAKAGLVSLVKTMALEWGPYGIRVNAIGTDATLTPRVATLTAQHGFDPNIGAPQPHRPLPRMCTPAEQASVLLFFVSDLASYVTGQTLLVDGGLFWVMPGRTPSTMPAPAQR